MENEFAFNAPQFYDFSSQFVIDDSTNVEAYFETDHEHVPLKQDGEPREVTTELIEAAKEYAAPTETDHEHMPLKQDEEPRERTTELIEAAKEYAAPTETDHEHVPFKNDGEHGELITELIEAPKENATPTVDDVLHCGQGMHRRSMSVGCLLVRNVDKGIADASVDDAIVCEPRATSGKRLTRCASRDNLCKLAQPKFIAQKTKYVSMAEAINTFHSRTPDRFHSKSREHFVLPKNGKPPLTIPQSPHLVSKLRMRNVIVPTREQQEEKAFEEAKKFKIKANPINAKVLQGPLKIEHPKKYTTTIVQPFNLTECATKVIPKSPDAFQFHAKPVPKSVYNTPKGTVKSKKRVSVLTSNLSHHVGTKEQKTQQVMCKDKVQQPFVPMKTQLAPFSFEQRDQEILKRKEQLLAKVLHEEKKAREFHANPRPKYLNNKMVADDGSGSSRSTISFKKSEEDIAHAVPAFKALPPTILYKKPFQPKKSELPLTEITMRHLNTEQRAKAREEFDKQLKQKEERWAELKKQALEAKEEQQRYLIAEQRKRAEHKANPIRHYKEMKIVSSENITIPVSPVFHTSRHRNKDK